MQIIVETNKVRTVEGLSPVSANAKLDLAASEKLNDMVRNGYFAHVSPEGVSPWFWMTEAGYQYTYAGENLALGFADSESTVAGWMNSPSHKANLLNGNYTEIGVATGKADLNGVSGILVVQMFGKSSTAVAVVKPVSSPKITPVATPNPINASTPLPSSVVSGSEAVVLSAEELNRISTDDSVPSVGKPIEIANRDSLNINSVSNKLNLIYQAYMVASIIVFGVAILFLGAKKNLILATAGHFALLIAAASLPSVNIASSTFIF